MRIRICAPLLLLSLVVSAQAGGAAFGTQQVISTAADDAFSVFAADLDGDGDLDVLSASQADDKIAWYENTDGVGGFGSGQIISTAADGALGVFAADVDGDGDLDALSASEVDDKIAWYENTDGAGSFGSQRVISTAALGSQAVFAADVDGDGDVDVLSASESDDKIAWYENTDGAGSFGAQQVISTAVDGAWSVFAADGDGDGDLDVLSASAGNEIAWHENTDGAGSFGSRQVISTAVSGCPSLFSADLDGDGDLDVLSASLEDDKIAWYENRTIHRSAVFPTQTTISTALDYARSVFGADVDGDGDVDVLAASYEDDRVIWYENLDGAGSFSSEKVVTRAADGPWSVFAADMDGDGDRDVLSASHWDDEVAWYENMNGAGSFDSQELITTAADAAHSVFAADVDGDGDLDVLSASALDDKIAWYENLDGAGSFGSQQVISTAAGGAHAVFAADVDGDGDPDALSASFEDDKIAWYENLDGAGSFGGQQIISMTAGDATSVFGADVDGDGDVDVLAASALDDEVAWYENTDGAGSFGVEQVVSTAVDGPRSIFGADVDGDGDLDVLSASRNDNRIAWYENRGGQFALETAGTAPAALVQEGSSDLLEIVMTHRGRAGDGDEELATLGLLFEEAPGDPLSSAEANALIDSLAVYRDSGSGVFEASADTLVDSLGTLTLTAGRQTLTLTDGHAGAQVAFGTPGTFFVVVTLTSDANSQTPHWFRVTHAPESGGTAEDRSFDIPLLMEPAAEVSSRTVLAASLVSDEDDDRLYDIVETGTGVYVSTMDTGTDPFNADSDGDGFDDGWEVALGSDPNDPLETSPPWVPALGPWGQALLLLALAGSAARGLRLRDRRGSRRPGGR